MTETSLGCRQGLLHCQRVWKGLCSKSPRGFPGSVCSRRPQTWLPSLLKTSLPGCTALPSPLLCPFLPTPSLLFSWFCSVWDIASCTWGLPQTQYIAEDDRPHRKTCVELNRGCDKLLHPREMRPWKQGFDIVQDLEPIPILKPWSSSCSEEHY